MTEEESQFARQLEQRIVRAAAERASLIRQRAFQYAVQQVASHRQTALHTASVEYTDTLDGLRRYADKFEALVATETAARMRTKAIDAAVTAVTATIQE